MITSHENRELAFMLNITSKSDNETLITWICGVSRNLSCHATSHQRSHQIASKQGNQNPQNNMIASFSFSSTAHVTQWSNYLTQQAEIFNDLTIKFNASTGEESSEWFVCSGFGPEVTFNIKPQVGFTVSSLFLPRPAGCTEHFTPNGSNFSQHFTAAEYTEKENWSHGVGLDRYLGTSIRESAKLFRYS